MKPTLYLETTIVSYLTARPSRDLIVAAHQQITKDWWNNHRKRFEYYVSLLVIQEAKKGDKNAAQKKLTKLSEIKMLEMNQKSLSLSKTLLEKGLIPTKAVEDAMHIALAAVLGIEYLLTWNCNHIANAKIRHLIEYKCSEMGYEAPVICTPEELMGG